MPQDLVACKKKQVNRNRQSNSYCPSPIEKLSKSSALADVKILMFRCAEAQISVAFCYSLVNEGVADFHFNCQTKSEESLKRLLVVLNDRHYPC